MNKSKKILFACIGVLVVVGAVVLGIFLGSRMNRAEPAAAEPTAQAETTVPAPTEYVPDVTVPEETEPAVLSTEPQTQFTQAPTTQATTAKQTTTKPATTKAATAKPTTTAAPATTAPAAKPATTAAPTTAAPTTAANRSGAYTLIVYSDGGASEVTGGGRYAAGEFVKVSMTPLLGYTFRRWESSDKNVIADSTSQTYFFQMPASNVTLRAVTYTRPMVSVNKGTGIASVSGGRYYTPGEKVTVSAQVAQGYEFAGWTSSPEGLSSSQPTFTFNMPEQSITLTASAKVKSYSVRVIAGSGVQSVSGEDNYKPGDTVTLRINMKEDYTLNRFDGLNAGYNGSTVTFTMPANDVLLTATGTQVQKYTVTLAKGEGIYSYSGGGRFAPGSTVTITCTVNKGYSFAGWKSSDTALVHDSSQIRYSFTMPNGNVTLTAYAEKDSVQYRVTVAKGTGIYSVQGGGMYSPGETVTVDCALFADYGFSEWIVDSSAYIPNGKTQRFSFIMPDNNVTLTAIAESLGEPEFGE